MSSGLIPVKERSIRTTDRVALNLFRQLRRMTAADRRFVLSALDSRIGGALDERVVAVRSAAAERERAIPHQPLESSNGLTSVILDPHEASADTVDRAVRSDGRPGIRSRAAGVGAARACRPASLGIRHLTGRRCLLGR